MDNLSAVAGYGDGQFTWSSAGWARFPSSIIPLSIVVSASHSGDILDVEESDATPGEVPGWVRRFNRPARRAPTVYCNRVTWPQVIAALKNAGIDPLTIDYWISTLDGSQSVSVPNGGKQPVAIQYVDAGTYDESIILDPSWVGGTLTLDPNDPIVQELRNNIRAIYWEEVSGYDSDPNQGTPARYGQLKDFPSVVAGVASIQQTLAGIAPGGGLTAAQAQTLSDIAATLARIETALKAA